LLAEYPANGSASTPQKEYGYRNGQLLVSASSASRVNFANSTNGATVTAQNYTQDGVYPGYHFYPSSAIDGQRYGHLIAGGGDINDFWRDEHGLPSWLEVDFNGTKTIDEVDVFTVPECPACLNQSDPSPTQTFSQYGATAFDVQYWTGSSWVTVPGGSITGNNLVWRKINFVPITTSKIRVVVNAAATDGVARIAEVEAWGSSAPTNVALTTNGATVSAQNYTQDGVYPGYHFYPSSAIDGQRYGHLIAGGDDINGFWRDEHGLPSWLQVDFNSTKTIEEVDVFTVPECPACLNQSDPSPTQTFSQYGATAFDVQYWTGSSWVTVPGGSIIGNNLVWRKISFAPITTSKIRVVVNAAATDGVARIAEVEAWTGSTASTISNIQWLVTDHLGTPRMILDQSGSLASVKRHDYLPFGEELSAPTGLRASALGYSSSDGVRQQFTQKERDLETGLDYFGARYYASTQGRFTSVDPALTSASVSTPQSWNRYAYGFNNPLRYIDPTGAWVWSAALGGGATDEELRRNAGNDRRALQAANRIIERRNQFRNGLNDARAAGAQSDEPDTVARAVNAYGTENDNNGVTVTYGTTTGGTPAEAGPGPGPALTFDANGVATAQVLVTISDTARLDANALAQAIGHEGWHVADRQSFASYLNREIGAAGGLANFVGTPLETAAFNSPHNRTVQTTEFNAYIVSGLIAQGRDALGHNLPNSSFNGHEVWNRSWTAAERPGLRAVGAFEHVTTSSIYANKLNQRIFSP
ncbi:MAG TPA: RHS repeat-associated core domain-containing protein, partial [Pyrinomonadaceae bacterium]|nr:RHS repeat-associated core domain-containing protein [Pyrinomonadaceae bacterium]